MSNVELTPEQERIKAEFIEGRGYWADFWDDLLVLDPELLEAHLRFTMVPVRKGYLEPKVREFLYIAIDGTVTHLYEPGLRAHIRQAFEYGATKEEIMEVLECISSVGIHAVTMGVPVLAEELRARGELT